MGFVNDVLVVRTAGAVVVVVVGLTVDAAAGRIEVLPAVLRRNRPALDPAGTAEPDAAGFTNLQDETGSRISRVLFCIDLF